MILSLQRRRLPGFWIAALVWVAGAAWLLPSAAAKIPDAGRQSGQEQTSGAESPLPVFELHSGFWINLHHFLYLQARLTAGNPSSSDNGRGQAPPSEPPASLLGFPEKDIHAWQDAVTFYAKDLAKRDLLLNGDMENINNRLAEMETCPDLDGASSPSCKSGLRPDLIEALQEAAPVYSAHWWPEQDRANREWIARVAPMVRQLGLRTSTKGRGRRTGCVWTWCGTEVRSGLTRR
jgi:hypothetical protein